MTDAIARNNVMVSGEGEETLIFGHGLGCDQRIWRRMLPLFQSTHRVVTFDHVGSGNSDRAQHDSRRYATLSGYATDVLELCTALDLESPTFIGHSVSGMIGVLAAIEQPRRFSRLVLIAPSPRYINDPPNYIGGFERADIERLLELMDQNFIGWATALANIATAQPELAQELRDNLCAVDRLNAREFARATFYSDYREELARVEPPTLVIQCVDDDIAPLAVGEYTARRLPHGELAVLNVSGHLPHMSNPNETTALIREFIQRVPAHGVTP